ncbi:uncharacterized protein [Paramisgurnus dabryanus]|uniref:uncharacterized protein n=1 Tax=Paramisgurnus dabryanus TaxID=90735 RepID=UPI003CCF9A1B
MQQERLSFIFLLVILCRHGVKAVDLTACEGETAQLTCGDLTSEVIACDSDTANLHCDQGHIKVLSANYGRTNSATCSSGKNEISNIQCTQDSSLSVLASRCDGRKYCSIPASNTVFGDPCVGTYKYLNVSYICIPSSAIIQKRTTCEGDTISINCNNRFIKVLSAHFGRTNSATCSTGRPSNEISNVQCIQSSTLSVLADQCDGTHACFVYASATVFGDPCPLIFKYLNVSYICHPNNQFIKVSAANYGRTNSTACSTGKPADQISNVQCSQSSSLSVLTTQCDGLKDCYVPASTTVFGDPCSGTYKYLNVSYTCGPVFLTLGKSAQLKVIAKLKAQLCLCLYAFEGLQQFSRHTVVFLSLFMKSRYRAASFVCTVNMQQGRMSFIFLLVLLCQCGVKAVDLTTCEGATAQLSCGLTSHVFACESDTASIHCDQGRIKVLSANYGRTNSATCSSGKPADQISNVQCTQSSSLSVLASRCDEKQNCSISVNNTVFGEPCVGTYKYLDLSYVCIPPSEVIQTENSCEGGTFGINCYKQFIKVLSANYGRTNNETCSTGRPADQISNVQCSQSSSLSLLANQCNGKQACSVSTSNTVFSEPCVGTYKYLNVSYICQPNNHFIKVSAANYGRTNNETCSTGRPAGQISNVQCFQNSSLSVLAAQCDGKQDCSIPATNTVFGDPCVGTYKYLDLSYTCGPAFLTKK